MPNTAGQAQLAVFIDFENLALGIQPRVNGRRRKRDEKLDMQKVLERLVEKGKIVAKRAYCDWQRFPEYVGGLHELGIELTEIPERHLTGKNSADIRLVVDALEMGYSKGHIDTFVIVSGDSDFLPLVSKLKENGKSVIGVGLKESTSDLLAANCDEFIFYDDLGVGTQVPKIGADVSRKQRPAYKLLFETMDAMQRENIPTLHSSLIKDTIKRKLPQFSERSYGFRSFNALLEEAAAKGYIDIARDQRSGTYYVEGFTKQ
ncbi:MAG: NYN domain-containing protein [Actinomycetes bacterium]|jgi:uncharacterized protein (TIGR00288 family)|nr:NYN domain-containing protein [Actinomycetes bacterium]